MKYLLSLSALLLTSSLFAQQVDTTTHLGTSIAGKLKTPKIELTTKHGQLSIIPTDIESIQFGYHAKSEMQDNIKKWIKDLGSVIVKQREEAHKQLIENYRYSYFPLRNTISKDREVSKRIETLLISIKEDKNNQFIPDNYEDTVNLWSGETYKGTITNTELIVNSDELDNIAIDIIHAKSMLFTRKFEFTITPAEIGHDWFDTRIDIRRISKITITGKLDMFPNDAGKYVCGPNGLGNASVTTDWINGTQITGNCGMVFGRIGSSHHFIIGSHYQQPIRADGRLFLRILGAPTSWEANLPTGSYKVTIE